MGSPASLPPAAEAALRGLFPAERLLFALEEREARQADRKTRGELPAAVALPTSTAEVAALLRWANEYRQPVFPRGAGTNSTGACVPLGGGVVLDLMTMNRLLELDAADLSAVCEPGLITGVLIAAAESAGLFYGPDPAGWRESTIGGNVATNAGGPSTLKYGVTRDWLRELEVVLPTGEVLRTGAKTPKTVAGYDLTRLICGAQGTLGVITRIRVKLLPKPPCRRTLLVSFTADDGASRAVAAANALFQAGVLPCALEFLDRSSSILFALESPLHGGENTTATLLLAFDGNEPGVREDLLIALGVLKAGGGLAADVPAGVEAAVWAARSRLSPLLQTIAPGKLNEDVCVPRGNLVGFLTFLEELERDYGLSIPTFGHLGDGNLHVNVMHQPEQSAAATQAQTRLLERVLELEGTVSGEHGIGLTKKAWLAREVGPVSLAAQRAIRQALDPRGVLNPGKLFD